MRIKFKYNGREYYPKNLDKKLNELGITINDIEIVSNETKKQEQIEYEDPNRLYYFINRKTGYSITSIYPECNRESYEPITYEELTSFWKSK